MMLLKIIMREGNMVIEFFMLENTPLHVENLEGADVLPSYACCFVLHLFIFLQVAHA